jgi:hypothetical protein
MRFVNRLSKEESADKDIIMDILCERRMSKVTWRIITEKSKKYEKREQREK